jgi:hypothetical protein
LNQRATIGRLFAPLYKVEGNRLYEAILKDKENNEIIQKLFSEKDL